MYTYIVRFVLASKQGRKAYIRFALLPVSKAPGDNFIFAFNVHIVSIYHLTTLLFIYHLTTLYVFDLLFYIKITKKHNNVVMVLEEPGSLYLISTLTFLFVVSL